VSVPSSDAKVSPELHISTWYGGRWEVEEQFLFSFKSEHDGDIWGSVLYSGAQN
jgi:hypothetical protein